MTTENQEPQEEEIVSRPNHLKFLALEVDSYAGLNYEGKSLVVHFPDNENIMELTGDQAAGKTSLLNGLKSLMGEPEPANAINSKSESKSASLTFEVDGETYKTRITSKTFTLTNLKEVGGKTISSSIQKPKDILSSLIGPIGVSPSFLGDKKSGEKQIEWIKTLAMSNPDLAAQEAKIKSDYDSAYAQRTEANRDFARLKAEMIASGYYIWEEENKVFHKSDKLSAEFDKIMKAPENEEELQENFRRAATKNEELGRARTRLEQLEFTKQSSEKEIANIDNEISRLNLLKMGIVSSIEVNDKSIKDAGIYIAERVNAPQEMEAARTQLQESGNIALLRKSISDATLKMKAFEQVEVLQETLNNRMTDAEFEIKELAKQYTPAIDGLEVELGNSIDNKRPTGVYYKGVNMAFLSESEAWDLCLQVWRYTGVSVVFIENSSSLGTEAMDRINWFAKNGGNVFMSTMQRNYKELKVSFHKEKE